MKKTTFFIAFLISMNCLAQSKQQTLFDFKNTVIGGFGSMILEFSSIDGSGALSTGGGGGVILNNFFIGGYGLGLTTPPRRMININNQTVERQLQLGHGGLWIGYDFKSYKLIHIILSAKLGWGGITYNNNFVATNINTTPVNTPENIPSDDFFVITPEIGAEVNITKFFRIAVTGSYRYINGIDIPYTTNKKLSSPAVNLMFKFGWFDIRRKKD